MISEEITEQLLSSHSDAISRLNQGMALYNAITINPSEIARLWPLLGEALDKPPANRTRRQFAHLAADIKDVKVLTKTKKKMPPEKESRYEPKLHHGLTKTEEWTVQQLADGLQIKEIAKIAGVSVGGIGHRLERIKEEFDLPSTNKLELVVACMRLGIIS